MQDVTRVVAVLTGWMLAALASTPLDPATAPAAFVRSADSASQRMPEVYMDAYITGYNTVVKQTDSTPCIAASGTNVCGRSDAAACPTIFKLGTIVEIHGKKYVCEDRTAPKFNGRFDINCDKDKGCPYQVAGWTTVKILFE